MKRAHMFSRHRDALIRAKALEKAKAHASPPAAIVPAENVVVAPRMTVKRKK